MSLRQPALRHSRWLAAGSGLAALLIGLSALLGWIFDSWLLKTGTLGVVTMKANAALALCACAGALLASLPARRSRLRLAAARGAAALAATIGALTLSQHLFGWNLGIDELLFAEPRGAAATVSPGRMGPPASASFVLLGLGLLAFERTCRRGRSVAQMLALAACPAPLLGVIGYVTGATQLYGIARYTGIAAHTALALLLLAIGLLLARLERQPGALLLADNPGGDVARTLLPAVVVLPIVLGWLRTHGERLGLYDTAFGRALLLLSMIAFFMVIVWKLSHRLSHAAAAHARAEQATSRARAELERLAAENLETLSVLESLLAHAPIGLVVFDRELRTVRVNDFVTRLADGRETRLGDAVTAVLPAFPPELEAATEQVFASGSSNLRVELTSPGEPPRHWLVGVFPVHDGGGAVTLGAAVLIEMTEHKQLQADKTALLESERAARHEAERAAALKDQFLATLSHELRTPLNAILGWAAIARKLPEQPAALQRPLEVIERNARAQAQLIDDLLDISRIVSGKMRLELGSVRLQNVVNAALNAIMPAAQAKQVRIQVESEPGLPVVRGDSGRLQQIVWNLLSNAIKFSNKGGVVELSLRTASQGVELAVRDHGAGIRPEFLPHVFDRFRQADSSTRRHHGGLGLGLSIVKQLVELHHGSVQATSAGENAGATFVVTFPADGERTGATDAPPPATTGPASLTGVDVLVVDDETDAREFVGRVLSDARASVRLAASVDDALSALDEAPAHVIVSDIGMPGKDGYDLIRALRAQNHETAVPAIAVTAFARAEDRARVLAAGFRLHLAKPVDGAELTRAVARLVGRSEVEA